jgi:hypothetical protein
MTAEQRKRIDWIAARAEKFFNWDFRDMAYDAVMSGDDRDDETIAYDLAQRAAYP